MQLQSLQQNKGHENRGRCIVESITDSVLFLCIATVNRKCNHLKLPRIGLDPGDEELQIAGLH